MKKKIHIIILAAGKGVRMRSNLPKVLQPLAGKALLSHVLAAAQNLDPAMIHIVHGSWDENLRREFCCGGNINVEEVNWVEQAKRLGTGHAVQQALPHIPDDAMVLVLCADVPMITAQTLQNLLAQVSVFGVGLITTKLSDPTGFGRIIRDPCGSIVSIVEQKDAQEHQLIINEINTGIIAINADLLKKYLSKIQPNNAQNEYYLTDVITLAARDGHKIAGFLTSDADEVRGVNDKEQLEQLERIYQKRKAQHFLRQGVTLIDAQRFDVRGNLQVGMDVVIDVNVIFEGDVIIGNNCKIGPSNVLRDVKIGDNVEIKSNCVLEGAVIENGCIIGPFARVRPTTHLKSSVHIGNFVEVKNTQIDEHSKANHLAYIGDAVIGKNVNVGAGTITCNYDGAHKHQTIIEDDVFIGSDTQFIAPVKIGKGATIGAGSTITQDAPAEKLTIARAKQVTVDQWQRPKKE